MWAIGLILRQTLTGNLKENPNMQDRLAGSYSNLPAYFPNSLSKLIKNLLDPNPEARPTCYEALQLIE